MPPKLVFLTDGVAVVFYKSMSTLAAMQDPIGPTQYVMMVGSFFSIAIGGLLIGILVGFLTALMTKTMSEVRVMEPLALLSMAYFAYMAAEVFHWSGIISMIGCGIVQAHYVSKRLFVMMGHDAARQGTVPSSAECLRAAPSTIQNKTLKNRQMTTSIRKVITTSN